MKEQKPKEASVGNSSGVTPRAFFHRSGVLGTGKRRNAVRGNFPQKFAHVR